MYLSVKYALEVNSVTPKTIGTSVCLMVLANPIIYVAALLGAILAFNFFVNLSVKYAVDEVFDLENHMLDTKITSLCLIVLKL